VQAVGAVAGREAGGGLAGAGALADQQEGARGAARPLPCRPPRAKLQAGLVRQEDNPEGRRMRAVFMGADDIVGTLQTRLLSLGCSTRCGDQHRQARTGDKMLFLALCVGSVRRRTSRRRMTKLFAAGLFDCLLLKMRARGRLATQFLSRPAAALVPATPSGHACDAGVYGGPTHRACTSRGASESSARPCLRWRWAPA